MSGSVESDYKFVQGAAFMRPSNDGIEHLHIILTNPMLHGKGRNRGEKVIMVNATSIKGSSKKGNPKNKIGRHDTTYPLPPGIHDDIVIPSYTLYKKATIMFTSDLYEELKRDIIEPRKPFNLRKTKEMAKGILKAPKISGRVKSFYREYRLSNNENRESRSGFIYTRIKEDEWKKPSIWDLDFRKNFEWKRDIWD